MGPQEQALEHVCVQGTEGRRVTGKVKFRQTRGDFNVWTWKPRGGRLHGSRGTEGGSAGVGVTEQYCPVELRVTEVGQGHGTRVMINFSCL